MFFDVLMLMDFGKLGVGFVIIKLLQFSNTFLNYIYFDEIVVFRFIPVGFLMYTLFF